MDISEGSTIGGSVARASGAFLFFSGFPIKPFDWRCQLCPETIENCPQQRLLWDVCCEMLRNKRKPAKAVKSRKPSHEKTSSLMLPLSAEMLKSGGLAFACFPVSFRPVSNHFQYKNAGEIVNCERKRKVETDAETGTSATGDALTEKSTCLFSAHLIDSLNPFLAGIATRR